MLLKSLIGRVFSWMYRKYIFQVFPRVNNLRGTMRLYLLLQRLSLIGIEKVDEDPTPIYDLEWDNLVVLDACRHDLYESFEGETDYTVSVASATPKFIEKTFSSHDFSDTVLITANPHFSEDIFRDLAGREVDECFHTVFHTYQNRWDDSNNTVMPESVVEDALTAEKLFPGKRKIIWFMQPHYPFISDRLSSGDGGMAPDFEAENQSIWQLAMQNKVDRSEVYSSYRRNLEEVLEHVKDLGRELEGRTLLTSDHGNFLEENGLYGHSMGDQQKAVRKVPLDELDG